MKKQSKTDSRGALKLDPFQVLGPVRFDAPARITNASSRAPYVPPAWHVREGAEDHKRLKSRGIDA